MGMSRRIRMKNNNMEMLSTIKITYSKDLYKIVDLLNRTLKDKHLMFGLALDEENNDDAIFTVYRS